MIINRFNDVHKLAVKGLLELPEEGPFEVLKSGNSVYVMHDNLNNTPIGRIYVAQANGRVGEGHVVGRVSDITAERERIGREIDGPGPLFAEPHHAD